MEDDARARLAELHAEAAQHNPKAPSPERIAELRARVATIDPATLAERLTEALEPELAPSGYLGWVERAWAEWDDLREPHAKALAQMRLAMHIPMLLEHVQALAARIRVLERELWEAEQPDV